MKNEKLSLLCCTLAGALLILSSCEENDVDMHRRNSSSYDIHKKDHVQFLKPESDCKLIDFDTPALSAGNIIDEVYTTDEMGPVKISGFNPRFGADTNAAMIFDTNSPTGGDPDLGTPNKTFGGPGKGVGGELGATYENNVMLNNVLIVTEDLDEEDPDDEGAYNGTQLVFDFSEFYKEYDNVMIKGIDILDVEESETGENAFVELLDDEDNVIEKILLPAVGDNGYAHITFEEVSSVYKMVVEFRGSGAVDNISFCPQKSKSYCNGKDYDFNHKYDQKYHKKRNKKYFNWR